MLADSLLTSWGGSSTPSAARRNSVAEALARTLVNTLGQVKGSRTASSIASLTEQLNALHYHSRWEAGAAGPRLIFGHCPYAAVIADHPELCQMDALAISRVTGSTARQLTKIDASAAGVTQCVFSLHVTERADGRIKGARTRT